MRIAAIGFQIGHAGRDFVADSMGNGQGSGGAQRNPITGTAGQQETRYYGVYHLTGPQGFSPVRLTLSQRGVQWVANKPAMPRTFTPKGFYVEV